METTPKPVVMVTGGGRGIGRAICERSASEGALVVVTDIDEVSAKTVAATLGPDAIGLRADISSMESVEEAVAQVQSTLGRIDVLVNNAGWDKAARFVDSDRADWDTVIMINLYGVLNTCKAVLPIMISQNAGSVINVASDAGRVGSANEAVYAAAKGGVIAFTKSIARELARYEIRANAVCPGPTDTALFASIGGDDPKLREALTRAIPMRRLGQPSDLAGVVAFLASPDACFVTGQTISVSGGLTMA